MEDAQRGTSPSGVASYLAGGPAAGGVFAVDEGGECGFRHVCVYSVAPGGRGGSGAGACDGRRRRGDRALWVPAGGAGSRRPGHVCVVVGSFGRYRGGVGTFAGAGGLRNPRSGEGPVGGAHHTRSEGPTAQGGGGSNSGEWSCGGHWSCGGRGAARVEPSFARPGVATDVAPQSGRGLRAAPGAAGGAIA